MFQGIEKLKNMLFSFVFFTLFWHQSKRRKKERSHHCCEHGNGHFF